MFRKSPKEVPTAALLIIGNEIISGQTQDQNASFLAQHLQKRGIAVREHRTVLDREDDIVEAVKALRLKYTYVFTTGGIGPTHDDITAAAMAKAFGRKLHRNPEAQALLEAKFPHHPKEHLSFRMADMPEGVLLIPNPLTVAPGFQIENVFVLAGIPDIMRAMITSLDENRLPPGPQIFIRQVFCDVFESQIGDCLASLQRAYPSLEIGSYPSWTKEGKKEGVKVVFKSLSTAEVEAASHEFVVYAQGQNFPTHIVS